MPTSFPTSLDSFPSAATLAGHSLATDPHSALHGNLGDALAALEAKVGVDGSAVTTSIDYVMSHLTEGRLSLSDVTTANATTGRHGFLPKLSGSAAQFLDGSGAWSTPAGGSPGGASGNLQYNAAGSFGGATGLSYAGSGTNLTVTAQAATDVPLVAKGTGLQSGDLQQWQNSSAQALAALTAGAALKLGNASAGVDGSISFPNRAFTLTCSNFGVVMGGGSLGVSATGGQLAADKFNLDWTNGDVGLSRTAAGVLKVTNGASGGGLIHLPPVTAPGTPSSGIYLYCDTADNKLKCKGSSGTVTVLGNP